MADASSTTRRRKQRTLFADKVIQQTNFEKGWKNYIKLEGGYPGLGAISAPPYLDMIDGATETTNAQRLAYVDSVPDKVRVPDAPSNVVATTGNAQASVSFTAPSNGGSPITGYKVTSSPATTTQTGTTSPILFTGLTNGTSYTFGVIATNAIGDSPASAPSNAVTPVTTPAAPTSLSATAGDGEASISFTAGNDGGSEITNYEYSTDGSSWTALSPTDVTSPVTITGLTNGVAYTIYLRAVNAVGSGASSSEVSVTPVATTISFTTVGSTSWTAPTGVTSIDYVVIGGGGGGGGAYDVGGGGGGGGGLILNGTKSVTPGTTYTITVGGGGAGGTGIGGGGGDTDGASGNSSSFDNVIATGGGSGGGSLNNRTGTGGAQGNAGTATAPTGGRGGRSNGPVSAGGGGGGGMGSAGTSASSNAGAAGGSGITVTIGSTSVSGGAGGNGGDRGSNYNGANGTANTGNGGGGGAAVSNDGSSGGAGGSGRVVIKY